MKLRIVKANAAAYIRLDDVINVLLELAATEETDTRNRLEQLA